MLPGLAPPLAGKAHWRYLKAGTVPSVLSFRRLPVDRLSLSERRAVTATHLESLQLEPKVKKAKRRESQAEFELRCALEASTKRVMELESTCPTSLPRTAYSGPKYSDMRK